MDHAAGHQHDGVAEIDSERVAVGAAAAADVRQLAGHLVGQDAAAAVGLVGDAADQAAAVVRHGRPPCANTP